MRVKYWEIIACSKTITIPDGELPDDATSEDIEAWVHANHDDWAQWDYQEVTENGVEIENA